MTSVLRERFIHLLAEYLAGDNQVKMSMRLQTGIGLRDAQQWQALRAASPLHGYPTVEDAEALLTEFLT